MIHIHIHPSRLFLLLFITLLFPWSASSMLSQEEIVQHRARLHSYAESFSLRKKLHRELARDKRYEELFDFVAFSVASGHDTVPILDNAWETFCLFQKTTVSILFLRYMRNEMPQHLDNTQRILESSYIVGDFLHDWLATPNHFPLSRAHLFQCLGTMGLELLCP